MTCPVPRNACPVYRQAGQTDRMGRRLIPVTRLEYWLGSNLHIIMDLTKNS